jgi:hypothetical protein
MVSQRQLGLLSRQWVGYSSVDSGSLAAPGQDIGSGSHSRGLMNVTGAVRKRGLAHPTGDSANTRTPVFSGCLFINKEDAPDAHVPALPIVS